MESNTRLFVGKENKIILVNNRAANRLCHYALKTKKPRTERWEWASQLPDYTIPPDNLYSPKAYPLRINLIDTLDEAGVILLGRPLGGIIDAEIDLHTEKRDTIRLTFNYAVHQDVIDTLVDLGVEVIIEEK